MNKICPKCKSLKDIEEFSKNKSKKDKHNSTCKVCSKKYTLEYKNNGKAKIRSDKYRTNAYGRYRKLLLDAKKRNLEVLITQEEQQELIKNNCFYCKGIIGPRTGLDRIDNSKGYTKDNILAACGNCNKFRNVFLTVEETLQIINLLKTLRNKEDIWL